MDVYNITKCIIIEIPEMKQEVVPLDDLVWVAHEIFEEREFFEGEGERETSDGHRMFSGVEMDGARGECFRRKHCFGPPQDRVDAGDQLLEREGLDHVVVGSGEQEIDFVFGLGLCGQDENRHRHVEFADSLGDLGPGDFRKHEVKHDEVVFAAVERDAVERTFAVMEDIRRESFERKSLGERKGEFFFIIDNQDLHRVGGAAPAEYPKRSTFSHSCRTKKEPPREGVRTGVKQGCGQTAERRKVQGVAEAKRYRRVFFAQSIF